MDIRYSASPMDAKHYDTEKLRQEFLVETLFVPNQIQCTYSHVDRMVVLGIEPVSQPLVLGDFLEPKHFGTDYFLMRRELGIINIGGSGSVIVDQQSYQLNHFDGLYVGQGAQELCFKSDDANLPAKFYAVSSPAHCHYPNQFISQKMAKKIQAGQAENSNQRVINQYIHPDVLPTCQLSMGLTQLASGSVWNTMPAHTHERRMEVYLYLDLSDENIVFHYMGEPTQTRHIIIQNEQVVISPSWSIHSGCGTSNYSFIWAMAGENQTFDDMDHVLPNQMR